LDLDFIKKNLLSFFVFCFKGNVLAQMIVSLVNT
jgi:hypothetical protein